MNPRSVTAIHSAILRNLDDAFDCYSASLPYPVSESTRNAFEVGSLVSVVSQAAAVGGSLSDILDAVLGPIHRPDPGYVPLPCDTPGL